MCAAHVFSTKDLSILHEMLIGLKDQFDLRKLLKIFYENKTWTLRLVFLLMFLVKAEQAIILGIKEEEYFLKHSQSDRVNNSCIDWVLLEPTFISRK